jgi:hypothetical protein
VRRATDDRPIGATPRHAGGALVVLLLGGCQGPPSALTGSTPAAGDAAAAVDAALGCDPLAQDCSDGQACVWIEGGGGFVCVESLGLPRYHACEVSGHCSAGDGCHLDDRIDFYCIAYCDHATYPGLRDPGRCDVAEICGELDGDIGRCLGICQALSSNCPPGLACYLVPDAADLCFPVLTEGFPGTACARDNDCAPGSGCLGEPPRCTVYCDHENYPEQAEPRCAEDAICTALVDEDRIGACAAAP